MISESSQDCEFVLYKVYWTDISLTVLLVLLQLLCTTNVHLNHNSTSSLMASYNSNYIHPTLS